MLWPTYTPIWITCFYIGKGRVCHVITPTLTYASLQLRETVKIIWPTSTLFCCNVFHASLRIEMYVPSCINEQFVILIYASLRENGDDLVYKWAPIKLWETNYLNKLNGVSVIYQIRRFRWEAIIIIFGDMFHSCELRVRASLISNTCFLWHSLYAFPPNTRDVLTLTSARLILADELCTKQPASSNTTNP